MAHRILIIEDHPDNMELMRYLLASHAHTVLQAFSAEQGLERLQAESVDIVICDMQLPAMNGYGFIRTLRSLPALGHIPVIAVTALAMDQDRKQILAAGFDGYITKPITPETFVDEIIAPLRRDN